MNRIEGIGVSSIHDTIEFMHIFSWPSFSINNLVSIVLS